MTAEPLARPSRLWWWVAAGALQALVGVIGVARTWAFPPAEMMMSESGPPPALHTLGMVTSALEVLGYVALVAGPWSGWRRIWATVVALLAVLPTLLWYALPEPGVDAGTPEWMGSFDVVGQMTRLGLLYPLLTLLLVWQQGHRRTLTARMIALVVVISLLVSVGGGALMSWVSRGEQPDMDAVMMAEALVPAASSVLFGLGWLTAAAISRRSLRTRAARADSEAPVTW